MGSGLSTAWKRFFGQLRHAMLAALVLALAASASAQTVDGKPEVKAEILERISRLLKTQAFVPGLDLDKWSEHLAAEKERIDAAANDEEFARAVNAALGRFKTSHFEFASPRAAENRRNAAVVGIGISSRLVEEGVLVLRLWPKAPADLAGIQPGDIIIEADGVKPKGVGGLIGAEGSEVKLKVKRRDGTIQDFTLTRKKFSTVRKEELFKVDKTTARLAIYTFDWTYDRANVELLMDQARKYPNLIIDLRDNGGGAVLNLQHLLGLLIPVEEPVGTFLTRSIATAYRSEHNGKLDDLATVAAWSREADDWYSAQVRPSLNKNVPPYKGKVVVLINERSGSASEIVAAALRDHVGARVVGSKSAGAVLVSLMLPATNKFQILLPIADYVTVKGVRLEGTGVSPDVEIADAQIRLPDEPDRVVEKAVELLTRVAIKPEG